MSDRIVRLQIFDAILDDMCPFCKKRALHILASGVTFAAPTREPLLELLTKVSARHGLTNAEVIAGPQTATFVRVRQEFSVEAHRLGYSFPEIGRVINRHHTSIVHLVHKNGNGNHQ